MKKILVPVDFSDHTQTVVRYALEIAKKNGGELRLFHAYFDFMIAPDTSFTYSVDTNAMFNQEMLLKVKNQAKVDMQNLEFQLVNELKKEGRKNVKVVYTLTGGLPEDEIINISEIYNPDLIVMGTRGKGEKDILTGKVSSKVVQDATCRILTVPRDASYHGFSNILYATDFSDNDVDDIQTLIDLLSNYNPVIHCVHVDVDQDMETDKIKMEGLRQHFSKKADLGEIVFDIFPNDDFLKGVDNYVKEKDIDMVTLVHRRKSFLKRLFRKDHTRELLFHSDLPLYIFPGH